MIISLSLSLSLSHTHTHTHTHTYTPYEENSYFLSAEACGKRGSHFASWGLREERTLRLNCGTSRQPSFSSRNKAEGCVLHPPDTQLVISYSIMLLCSLSCVGCRLADSWMFTRKGWKPQMRDLMKELFQLVFAGNEEKNEKPLSVFRPRPNMTTLRTQVDSVTTKSTCSMVMTLGFLATVSWQEELCFMELWYTVL